MKVITYICPNPRGVCSVDIDSNNIEYLNFKMSALSFTGKNDEIINFGEEMLQKEIKLSNLDKQSIYSALMSAYEKTGKYDKALQYSDKAISISEDRKRTAIYYATKGNIHHKLNQYKKALEFYKKGSEIVEMEDEIYEAMSFFYEELGDTNGMLQFLPLLYNYNTSMKRLFNSYGDEIAYLTQMQ